VIAAAGSRGAGQPPSARTPAALPSRPSGARPFRRTRWYAWQPSAAPATRQGRAEEQADRDIERTEGEALLDLLESYRNSNEELAQGFEALYAGDIAAALARRG
jgi:hypothetical protein